MKIGNNYLAILGVTTVTTVMSCSPTKKEYTSLNYIRFVREALQRWNIRRWQPNFPLVTNSRRGAPDAL